MLSDEFERLLFQLDDDRERAGEKYEDIRRRLVRFFTWNDCFPEEDLADMTFDRVASKLPSESIHSIEAFIWGVAKNVRREFYKRPQPMNIDELPPDRAPRTKSPEAIVIEFTEEQRLQRCLQECIQKLSDPERELFIEYEHYAAKAQKMESLAAQLELTVSALRTRAHRIRHRVEACTSKCVKGLQDCTNRTGSRM